MKTSTNKASVIISLVLRVVAIAMAITAIVMSILGTVETHTLISMLSIGLFSLALDALDRGPEPE
jgi:hypothetical protein